MFASGVKKTLFYKSRGQKHVQPNKNTIQMRFVKSGLILVTLVVFVAIGELLATRIGFSDIDSLAELALPVALIIFILAAAVPFVPGAEIGFCLLVAFGTDVAGAVYVAMLSALFLAFFAGRLLPPEYSARHLKVLAARQRLLQFRCRSGKFGKSGGVISNFLWLMTTNKYLTLCIALNTPGNTILGGGGGLALFAGASRKFSYLGFGLTASVAVLPIPLVFFFLG